MIYINKSKIIDNNEWLEILDTLCLREKMENAKTIVIKPNFASGTRADPKQHVISDLNLLGNIISCISTINPHSTIYIAEGDSTGNGFAYEKFEHLGLPDQLNIPEEIQKQVSLLDLTRDRLKLCTEKKLKYFNSEDNKLWLSETLMNADFLISLSNLKTHSVTGYTGASKNLFGCLPAFDKSIYHTSIHKVIHDVTLTISPDLNIVDAFYGMEKNGPCQGIDIDTGYRVISNCPWEADYYAARSVGIRPFSVKYIKYLFKTSEVVVTEDLLAKVVRKYKKPQLFLRIMNSVGLFIQWIGQITSNFGHRVHACYNPLILIITIFRPLLLRMFDIDTLKRIKRRLLK